MVESRENFLYNGISLKEFGYFQNKKKKEQGKIIPFIFNSEIYESCENFKKTKRRSSHMISIANCEDFAIETEEIENEIYFFIVCFHNNHHEILQNLLSHFNYLQYYIGEQNIENLTFEDVFNFNHKFLFRCNRCNHKFEKSLLLMEEMKDEDCCPFCIENSNRVCGDIECENCTSKSFINHIFAEQWNLKLNKQEPQFFHLRSRTYCHFICKKCNKSFKSQLNNMEEFNHEIYLENCEWHAFKLKSRRNQK